MEFIELLLIAFLFAWIAIKVYSIADTLEALVKDRDDYRLQKLTYTLSLKAKSEDAAKSYSHQVSDGRFFRDLERGFVDGADWKREQIAEYLRDCLAQESTGELSEYVAGKVCVYRSILRDVENDQVIDE